jgi:hypothetical protein
MSEKSIEEVIEEAKTPAKFNIIDAIKERGYPSDEVVIFLDEDTAYKASAVQEKINLLDMGASKNDTAEQIASREEERNNLIQERDNISQKLSESKYTFILRGISEGQRDKIFEEVGKKIPVKYTSEMNPLTGEREKSEVENPERDKLFTNMLWAAYIEKIVSPIGEEQDSITLDEASELRYSLPLAGVQKINECIEKLRIAAAAFMYEVDEDFLAKS